MSARSTLAATVLGLALASVPLLHADAAPISAQVNRPLSTSPLTISFDGVMVVSLFAAATDYGPGASVATVGTGQVTAIAGAVTDFFAGSSIDQNGELYTFATFPAPADIPDSAVDDYIGLLAVLPDGVHYGYAEVFGPDLVSVGFESTAGASILTGATGSGNGITVSTQQTQVPEPASVALLLTGVALTATRRRRAPTAPERS